KRDDINSIVTYKNDTHIFPAHYHRHLEIFILKKGWYSLTVNEVTYDLSAGSIIIIDSFDVHSYDFKDNSVHEDCVLLVPYEFRKFLFPDQNKKIACPVIKSGSLVGEVLELIEKYFDLDDSVRAGALNLILSLISSNLSFASETEKDEITLMRRILSFIQQNYQGDVTRKTIATALGYTESYVSHVFHRYVNMGICEYVNRLRLVYVNNTLRFNEKKTINEVIYDAGFKSQQTYYRVKARYGLPDESTLAQYD
ncbi:MAG: helix-turn-helix transcriptional regulator, partial [Clostridia bacterium]|nr:helix-turn-helix transcriptional regulator [Clostridia bacterium]